MAMSKQDFIALADEIRDHNRTNEQLPEMYPLFTEQHIKTLASFCEKQNGRFMRHRWFDYNRWQVWQEWRGDSQGGLTPDPGASREALAGCAGGGRLSRGNGPGRALL